MYSDWIIFGSTYVSILTLPRFWVSPLIRFGFTNDHDYIQAIPCSCYFFSPDFFVPSSEGLFLLAIIYTIASGIYH